MIARTAFASSMVVLALAGCAGKGVVPGTPEVPASSSAVTPNPNAPVLGLAGLEARGVNDADAKNVADMVSRELIATGAFRVVDREQMSKVLADKAARLAESGTETDAEAAKLLNARYLGVGSFGMLMGSYVLNFRIVDAETGETRASASAQGKDLARLQAGIREMAAKLAAEKY
jgi:curli biogenesis system outer membrane secretion channel CsgG